MLGGTAARSRPTSSLLTSLPYPAEQPAPPHPLPSPPQLCAEIDASESSWCLLSDVFSINLEKRRAAVWPAVLRCVT